MLCINIKKRSDQSINSKRHIRTDRIQKDKVVVEIIEFRAFVDDLAEAELHRQPAFAAVVVRSADNRLARIFADAVLPIEAGNVRRERVGADVVVDPVAISVHARSAHDADTPNGSF